MVGLKVVSCSASKYFDARGSGFRTFWRRTGGTNQVFAWFSGGVQDEECGVAEAPPIKRGEERLVNGRSLLKRGNHNGRYGVVATVNSSRRPRR